MAISELCHYCIHWAIYSPHTAIWQVMHRKQLYPSLPQGGRALGPGAMVGESPSRSIAIYRDGALLRRKSSYNICFWAEEKPQVIVEQNHKQKFCASIRCDICDFPVDRMYFLHSWQTCKQGLFWEITAWIDRGCAVRLGPKYMFRAPRVYT